MCLNVCFTVAVLELFGLKMLWLAKCLVLTLENCVRLPVSGAVSANGDKLGWKFISNKQEAEVWKLFSNFIGSFLRRLGWLHH